MEADRSSPCQVGVSVCQRRPSIRAAPACETNGESWAAARPVSVDPSLVSG